MFTILWIAYLVTLELIKEENLILGLTQENLIESLV